MQHPPQQAARNEEPEVTQEEDVPVDRPDTDGEQLMHHVHNEKLERPKAATSHDH